jgi:hypothetical protein
MGIIRLALEAFIRPASHLVYKQEFTMKKLLTKSWLFLIILTLIVQTCGSPRLEIPVEQSFSTTITVLSTNAEFSKSASVTSLYTQIESIADANNFDSIRHINLQAVKYKIIANSSSGGTILNGNIQVSRNPEGNPQNLLNLTNFDPQSELQINHVAVLDAAGVTEIYNFLANILTYRSSDAANNLYYRLVGTATADGDINTDFSLSLTLVLSVVGIITD